MSTGIFTLGDVQITTAAIYLPDPAVNLDGMLAVSIQVRLAYGSGGSAIRAYLQTSLDQATTWIDIACLLFGTASATQVLNFSKLTPRTTPLTPSDGALADNSALDGILGDRLRLKIVSSGTYAGATVFSARAAVA